MQHQLQQPDEGINMREGERGYRARPIHYSLLIFAWFAFTAWVRPLSLPDEGRYVGVAWEMLRSGDWLVPTLDSLPYFHKPPLFYWLAASALATFGVNEWAARLPSLLAATGAAWALYAFVSRWTDRPTAQTSMLVLATVPFFFGAAQFATMDTLVAACITITIVCAAHAVLASDNGAPPRVQLAGAYVFAALGILAKGLIGVAIPAIVIGTWLLLIQRLRLVLQLIWLPGLALFGLIALPWFATMEVRHPGFLDYFFLHHHFERYLTIGFNNQQPFWFYLPAFAAITVPWCMFLPWAMRSSAHDRVRPELHALMWIWLTATLLFFSVPSSKLIGYVLPAVPPLSVLVAHAFSRLAGRRIGSRRHMATNAVGAAILCVALVVAYGIRYRGGIEHLATEIRSRVAPGDGVVAIGLYPFSVPFYLQHQQPVTVVEDWDAEWGRRKDGWRKELYDAARFAPERAEALLLKPRELTSVLCNARTWVFAREQDAERFPQLKTLQRITHNDGYVVWLAQPQTGRCVPNQ